MKQWMTAVIFAMLAATASALPSVADVEGEIKNGRFAQAESMMHEVVVAKPGSARGHYVYAELLAHNGKFSEAQREADQALQLDPALTFTTSEKFKAFQGLLAREQSRSVTRPAGGSSLDGLGPTSGSAAPAVAAVPIRQSVESNQGLPGWAWPAGLLAAGFVAWRLFSRKQAASPGPATVGTPSYASSPTNGPAPSYGSAPTSVPGTRSSGLMGAGLAAAGGVAAGMLAEKFLERGRETHHDLSDVDRNSFAQPQAQPDSGARELADRPVDLGNGNDWDVGSSGGESMDLGGGGGSGGGGDDQW